MFKLAQIISAIFNPLVLIIFITFGIVFSETQNIFYSSKWLLVAAVFSLLFAAFIVVGMKKGLFSNFDVSQKKQRPFLFFAGAVAVIICLIFVFLTNGSNNLKIGLVIALIGIATYQILVSKIKASVHMGILSVFLSLLISIFGVKAIPSVVLLPIVGWARVKEKEHTISEVIVGSLIGLVFSGLLIFLIQ